MDQPKQDGDDTTQNMNPDMGQENVSLETETPLENAPIQDEVLEGVPTSEPTSMESGDVSTDELLAQAEEGVAEASPQTVADELAVVATELEEASHAEPASTHSDLGIDPMEQITAEAEPTAEPLADLSEPATTMDETVDAGGSFPESEQSNVSSDSSAPTEDTSGESSNEQLASEESVTPETATEESTSVPVQVNDSPTEESVPTDSVDSEPETNSFTESESSNEAVPTMSNDEESSAQNDSPSVISDVIAPSAVAAAAASGTAGENAITKTPETSTVENAQSQASVTMQPSGAKKSSGSLKIVLFVLLVTLLFGGGAVAAYMMRPESSETSATEQVEEAPIEETAEETTEEETTAMPGEKVTATTLDDYKAVCVPGGLVSNATAYGGTSPHPVVVFEKGSDDKFAQSLVSFKDKTWSPEATKVTSGQLVSCISRKGGSEAKLKECPITDPTTKVTANVGFYSTTYTVDVYEALTGKKVSSFENKSISTTCPTNASYNKADPKIYAVFDQVALETSLTETVTRKF